MPLRSPDPDRRRDDIAACRAMLRQGSRTFHAASYLLPRMVREQATALYAFCRLADDAVDIGDGQAAALDRVRERLELVYAGRPLALAVDRAFAELVSRLSIPRALPDALLEGFEWDVRGRRYAGLPDLEAYAARVAGAVGAMMAMLMGARSADAVARACELGVAMQLSNIARDVGEDARDGRLYLPTSWLEAAGIEVERWLARPVHSAALAGVIERLLAAADHLYGGIEGGIACLPWSCRPGIRAASLLYAEIGHEVRRNGGDSISVRAVVPGKRKASLLCRSLAALPAATRTTNVPPLQATRYLVAAVAAAHPMDDRQVIRPPIATNPSARLLRVVDLFERLERREQACRARPGTWVRESR